MSQAKKEMNPHVKVFQEDKLPMILASLSDGDKMPFKEQ